MSTEDNKNVVKRWMTEVLEGGNLDVLDQVLATDYVNAGMGNADRDGVRAILTQMRAGASMHFTSVDLMAEGDAVVARFTLEVKRGNEQRAAQGLTYYRLSGGKIVVDDPFTRPDLAQLLGVEPPAQ